MAEQSLGRAVRGSCEARVKWFPYPFLLLTVPFVVFSFLFYYPIQISAQVAAPSPVHLTQVTPNSAVPGTQGLDIMLFGAGFAPGMQLRAGSPSVVVEYVQALSATLARARLRILPGAAPGPVRLDVISRDFTTFQQYTPPLFIQSPGGLAAPLSVRDAAVVYPQPGTLLAPDKPLFARGLLATTGSGVVIGVFTLDGVPFEQFSVIVSGGAPVSVQAKIPIPFTYAGTHDLQIKILSPQQFTSGPVRLVGIPESRTVFQLVTPAAKTVVSGKPPEFRWTVVPGPRHTRSCSREAAIQFPEESSRRRPRPGRRQPWSWKPWEEEPFTGRFARFFQETYPGRLLHGEKSAWAHKPLRRHGPLAKKPMVRSESCRPGRSCSSSSLLRAANPPRSLAAGRRRWGANST